MFVSKFFWLSKNFLFALQMVIMVILEAIPIRRGTYELTAYLDVSLIQSIFSCENAIKFWKTVDRMETMSFSLGSAVCNKQSSEPFFSIKKDIFVISPLLLGPVWTQNFRVTRFSFPPV